MKAVVLYGSRSARVEEVEAPRPPEGWALVRTELAGICGTDKAFYLGTYRLFKAPLIPGHEVVGRVVDGPKDLVGERVVPEINFSCNRCDYCRSGLYTHCPGKKTLGIDFDGGMAEYFVAPVEALHRFKGRPEEGVFVEPLAAVLRALSIEPVRPTDRVAVVGTGSIAWLLVQVLRNLTRVDVDVIARGDSVKAQYFKGVANVVTLDRVKESYYDVVFEVSGDPGALDVAIRIAKPLGVVHLKSTPGSTASTNTTVAVVKELKIVCSRCGTLGEFKGAVELLEKGIVKPILSEVYSIDRAVEAFEESLKREKFRIAIRP